MAGVAGGTGRRKLKNTACQSDKKKAREENNFHFDCSRSRKIYVLSSITRNYFYLLSKISSSKKTTLRAFKVSRFRENLRRRRALKVRHVPGKPRNFKSIRCSVLECLIADFGQAKWNRKLQVSEKCANDPKGIRGFIGEEVYV